MEEIRVDHHQRYSWMAIISLFLSVVSVVVVCGLGRLLAFSLACAFHVPYPVDSLWINAICISAVYVPPFLAMSLGAIARSKIHTGMALTSFILGTALFIVFAMGCAWVQFFLFFTDGPASC